MATPDWGTYQQVQQRVGSGRGTKADYQFLREFDFGDPMEFVEDGFNPYALTGRASAYTPGGTISLEPGAVRARYGYDPSDLSTGGFQKLQDAWATVTGNLAAAPGSGAFSTAVPERNVVWQDYAKASRSFYNAQQAGSAAATQTQVLQGRALSNQQRSMMRNAGAFFEDLKEKSEADVNIGSNIPSTKKPKRTSRSTPAATARSRMVVRAPGINI